ncbi:MAG TPA: hypothetical protein PKW69_10860, partial [Niabella sp.]|nr:hypothetical protein [Niabella sp.]
FKNDKISPLRCKMTDILAIISNEVQRSAKSFSFDNNEISPLRCEMTVGERKKNRKTTCLSSLYFL